MQRDTNQTGGHKRFHCTPSATIWLIAVTLLVGIAIGGSTRSHSFAQASDPNVSATATREAEIKELDDLRTRVAQPVVCTKAPEPTATVTSTPEPTPTIVPAVSLGSTVAYGEDWMITVTGIANIPPPDGLQPNGMLLSVNVTMENITNAVQWPPFSKWRLVSPAGQFYRADTGASQKVFGKAWGLPVAANDTEETGLVFDVPVDAGAVFVLESDVEPAFRIELTLESRG